MKRDLKLATGRARKKRLTRRLAGVYTYTKRAHRLRGMVEPLPAGGTRQTSRTGVSLRTRLAARSGLS